MKCLKKRRNEMQNECTGTHLAKTKQLHKLNGLSVCTIVKDRSGRFITAGSPDFERLVLAAKPVTDVKSNNINKYVSANLSFNQNSVSVNIFL